MELECCLTPATSNNKLAVVDNVVTIASLLSQAAGLVSPLSLALTIATKTYETIRGYQIMSDNVKHGVSTKLNKNMALTGNIISLTSSVVTLGTYMRVPSGKPLSSVSAQLNFIRNFNINIHHQIILFHFFLLKIPINYLL